jgi:hypothetical protein
MMICDEAKRAAAAAWVQITGRCITSVNPWIYPTDTHPVQCAASVAGPVPYTWLPARAY